MKKLLLIGAAALAAIAASAEKPAATPFEGEDMTSPAYRFHQYNGEWRGFVAGNSTMAWNMTTFWVRDHVSSGEIPFGDGLIYTCGPSFVTSDGQPFNGNVNFFDELQEATQVVDFGGELGKCLVINGKNSTLQQKLADKGVNVELKNFNSKGKEGNPQQLLLFVQSDPAKLEGLVKAGHNNYRVRITMNGYHAFDASTFGSVNDNDEFVPNPMTANIYANDDQNNVKGGPGTISNVINWNEFVYTWTEVTPDDPDDEPYINDNGATEWNPNRFLVYEFDATDVNIDEDNGLNSFRIKWGIHPSVFNQDAALIIRSIEFFVNDTNEKLVDGNVKKTYTYYTIGDEAGVSDAVAAPVHDGRIYNLQGIEVTNATIPGIYIQNGKKFIVR